MFGSTALLAAVLAGLALSSIYFIIILQFQNGTMRILDIYTTHNPAILPPGPAGESIALRHIYTNIWPLDALINRLTPFFWTLVTGVLPELSLFGVYMAGQLVASETLLLLEGARRGNKGRVVSYSTLWGLAWQNLPWGFVQPVYNLVHVLGARYSEDPTPMTITGTTDAIGSIPGAVVVGYILPSVIMCIPSPQYLSHDTHQALVFAWQLFPLWIWAAHTFITQLTPRSTWSNPIKALRNTYTFALLVACLSHLSIVALVLALIYGPADVQKHLRDTLPPSFLPSNPALVFTLFKPFGKAQVSELAVGVLSLLQYDTVFAGFSALLWATHLLCSRRKNNDVLNVVLGGGILILLFGPCGAALATVWKRDEEVFAEAARARKGKKDY
ncbi:Epoxide hydrolase ascI [Psilocybe cubensis]|uniref:Epoxide hydrolase ascI n=1 Tax=Psilocybe cubensis TaxID=181762 RepID=A0ACB8GN44_PSICU|nr:Epoxide hydrolase ascI [Psilocybe cubensis]KAH9477175.1 Epoxide hydrolase ascI [Psilocybe cubensis]